MTWTWLFFWNASWLMFALLYMTLETRCGGDSPKGGPGRNKLERREAEAPRKCRPVRARRAHRR
jgi:hypothetical protein